MGTLRSFDNLCDLWTEREQKSRPLFVLTLIVLATTMPLAASVQLGPYAPAVDTQPEETREPAPTPPPAAAPQQPATPEPAPSQPEVVREATSAPSEPAPAIAESQSLGLPAVAPQEALPLPAASSGRSPLAGSITRTAISLAVVIGMIIILAALYKKLGARASGTSLLFGASNRRKGGAGPSGIVEVLARYPLDAGLTLILLKVDRRVLLLSQSGSLGLSRFLGRRGAGNAGNAGLTTLAEFSSADDVASILMRISDAEGSSMNDRFRRLVERFDSDHQGGEPVSAVQATSRFVRTTDDGDRAELLDERTLVREQPPGETPDPPATYTFRAQLDGAAHNIPNPVTPPRRTSNTEFDAVTSLKRRLETMRTAGGGR